MQKALLNPKIYNNDKEFFEIDQKKILLSILKERLNISYAKLGKEFNLTWYPIYVSIKTANKKYADILNKVRKVVK